MVKKNRNYIDLRFAHSVKTEQVVDYFLKKQESELRRSGSKLSNSKSPELHGKSAESRFSQRKKSEGKNLNKFKSIVESYDLGSIHKDHSIVAKQDFKNEPKYLTLQNQRNSLGKSASRQDDPSILTLGAKTPDQKTRNFKRKKSSKAHYSS